MLRWQRDDDETMTRRLCDANDETLMLAMLLQCGPNGQKPMSHRWRTL